MIKNKFLSKDYNEELADIIEKKGFSEEAENLLLNMMYKIDDSYDNYKMVRREVPSKVEFIEKIIDDVKNNCGQIEIAVPGSILEHELQKNKCNILTKNSSDMQTNRVISLPDVKTLLYGISKTGLPMIGNARNVEEAAIIATINIGRCIANSEVLRDFNGWTWSINEREIESTECNIVYTFLSFLLGYKFFEDYTVEKIRQNVSPELFNELMKVSVQFYMSYDKSKNEIILKKIADDKKMLEKMKNQEKFVVDITEKKKKKIAEIKKIDNTINNPQLLRDEYLAYNSNKPDEEKIFSISHYEDRLQNIRKDLLREIEEINERQNPNEFLRIRDNLEYEIKFYEEKTDISRLQKVFLRDYERKIDNLQDRREIVNCIYEVRYLKYLPNCKMKLNNIEDKLLKKALDYEVLVPVSDNDTFDIRILKGIFDSQAICLEKLGIKIGADENKLIVGLFDGEVLDNKYDVLLPEGSIIEIKRSKTMRIFY